MLQTTQPLIERQLSQNSIDYDDVADEYSSGKQIVSLKYLLSPIQHSPKSVINRVIQSPQRVAFKQFDVNHKRIKSISSELPTSYLRNK